MEERSQADAEVARIMIHMDNSDIVVQIVTTISAINVSRNLIMTK